MNNNLSNTQGSHPGLFLNTNNLNGTSNAITHLTYLHEFSQHLKQALGSKFGHLLEVPHRGAGIEHHVAMLEKFAAQCAAMNHDESAMNFIRQVLETTLGRISTEGLESDTDREINRALEKTIAYTAYVPAPKNCTPQRFENLNYNLKRYMAGFLQPKEVLTMGALNKNIGKQIKQVESFTEIATDGITKERHLKSEHQDKWLRMAKKTGEKTGMLLSAALFTTGRFFFNKKDQPKNFFDGKESFGKIHSAIQQLSAEGPYQTQLPEIMKEKRSVKKLSELLNECKLSPKKLHIHTFTLLATKTPVYPSDLRSAVPVLFEHVHQNIDVKDWPAMYKLILNTALALDPDEFKLAFASVLDFIKTIEDEALRSKLLAELAPTLSRLPMEDRLDSAKFLTHEIYRLNDERLWAAPLAQLPVKNLGGSDAFHVWFGRCLDALQALPRDLMAQPLAHFISSSLSYKGSSAFIKQHLEKCLQLAATLSGKQLAWLLTFITDQLHLYERKHHDVLIRKIIRLLGTLDEKLIRTPLDSLLASLDRMDELTASQTRKDIQQVLSKFEVNLRGKLIENLANKARLNDPPIANEFLGRKREAYEIQLIE